MDTLDADSLLALSRIFASTIAFRLAPESKRRLHKRLHMRSGYKGI
jgi:hypothetical protein